MIFKGGKRIKAVRKTFRTSEPCSYFLPFTALKELDKEKEGQKHFQNVLLTLTLFSYNLQERINLKQAK